MKITFAGITICGAVGIDNPKEFSWDGRRKVQASEPIRAPQSIQRDRLNRSTSISFTVQRSHGTIQAAELFAVTHEDSLPGSGLLTLISDDGSHAGTTATYFYPAVLAGCKVKYTGILSFTTYTFESGASQSKKPAGT